MSSDPSEGPRLRIVHVIEGLHPDRGGPPVVAMSVAAAQVRLGHEVTIVCEEPGSRPDGVDVLIRATRDAEHVRIERIPKVKLFGALYGTLRGSAAAFSTPAALVHLHGVWNPIVLAAARTARHLKTPYILSSHGALHPSMYAIGVNRKRAALALGWRAMLRHARRVLSLNEEEQGFTDVLAGHRVATMVPNGVDLGAIAIAPERSFRNEFAALQGRPYFAFLGRLDRVKGLADLLEAYLVCRAAGSSADLVLIGPDWGEQTAITEAAHAAGVASNVHFTGPLYDERKLVALRDAIALVHRPKYEGFGLAVVEGMSVGTPAIIGDRCLLPTTGEDEGVVVVRGDAKDFAQAMLAIERAPERRATLSAAAIACVRKRFDWTAIARQTLSEAGVE